MDFKDYYQTLGVASTASAEEIKRAYRKLARKYHPDVSKELDAEARFKDVAEANEALCDVERRAAYDAIAADHRSGRGGGWNSGRRGGPPFSPPPGWDSGFEFSGNGADGEADHSDFFESLFGRRASGGAGAPPRASRPRQGGDHHAKIRIELGEAWRGGVRSVSLRAPVADAQGHVAMQARQLEVNIPKGVRNGQHLRLAGQGSAGTGNAPAGDLFLEIEIAPHAQFRLDGRDLFVDLPLAPWEAALGATVQLTLPDGSVELTVPPNARPGRQLRLKGKGLPGTPPGDAYAVLVLALPAAASPEAQQAWRTLADNFADFNPRTMPAG
jgi:curved DNA-binding protein